MERKIYKLLRHLQIDIEDLCDRMDELEEFMYDFEQPEEEEYEEEECEPEKAA